MINDDSQVRLATTTVRYLIPSQPKFFALDISSSQFRMFFFIDLFSQFGEILALQIFFASSLQIEISEFIGYFR